MQRVKSEVAQTRWREQQRYRTRVIRARCTLYRSKVSITIRAALRCVVQLVVFRHLRALPRSARRKYKYAQKEHAGWKKEEGRKSPRL